MGKSLPTWLFKTTELLELSYSTLMVHARSSSTLNICLTFSFFDRGITSDCIHSCDHCLVAQNFWCSVVRSFIISSLPLFIYSAGTLSTLQGNPSLYSSPGGWRIFRSIQWIVVKVAAVFHPLVIDSLVIQEQVTLALMADIFCWPYLIHEGLE